MDEFFTYKGRNYGIGTIVRYKNTYGNESTKTVYKITPKTAVAKKRIYLSNSIEDIYYYKYEQIDLDVFEKFAIVDVIGQDDTAVEWEQKVEKLRDSKKELDKKREENAGDVFTHQETSHSATKNDLNQNNKHAPPKHDFPTFYLVAAPILIALPFILIWFSVLSDDSEDLLGLLFHGICYIGGYITAFIGWPLSLYMLWEFFIETYAFVLSRVNVEAYKRLMIKRSERELKKRHLKNMEKQKEFEEIEEEHQVAVRSQSLTEPWAVKYSTSPCPYCGHYKVRCAKWEDKSISIAFWGIASSKIGTNYKCEHCKRMWE